MKDKQQIINDLKDALELFGVKYRDGQEAHLIRYGALVVTVAKIVQENDEEKQEDGDDDKLGEALKESLKVL